MGSRPGDLFVRPQDLTAGSASHSVRGLSVQGPLQIIANPNAAGGRGRKVLSDLERGLESRGLDYRLERTRRPGHAAELAANWGGSASRRILVVGGDGTLHEVVNGLGPSGMARAKLAIFPVGTGNDFHRMVAATGELSEVLDTVIDGVPRAFEIGRVRWEGGEEYFVNLMGLGLDVAVLRRRERFHRLPGLLQYLAALGVSVVGFRPLRISLEVETAGGAHLSFPARTLLSAITVGPSVGGGFLLSPEARPDDRALDLFVVDGLGLGGVIRHLPKVLRGVHQNVRGIGMHQIHCARIEADGDGPLFFELDGELMPDSTPWLEVKVIPDALRILEPPS